MSDYGSTPPPPPPPPGGGGYGAPPPPPNNGGGGYAAPPPSGAAAGGEHPEGQKLLLMSIFGLICCAPLNIYVLIQANNILKGVQPGPYTSKVNTAKIIAMIGLVLWVIGIILNLVLGGLGAASGK